MLRTQVLVRWADVWRTGSQPAEVRLRDGAIRTTHRREAAYQSAAPLPRLLSPRGIAVQLYLLLLLDAGCTPAHRPYNARRFWSDANGHPWWSLVVRDNPFETEGVESRRSQAHRQVLAAMRRLEAQDLGKYHGGSSRRPRGFALYSEGPRRVGERTAYTLPRRTQGISIPISFFLNGWVFVLSPAEILTWLAVRDRVRQAGGTGFVELGSGEAILTYGLGSTAFRSHEFLERVGLLLIRRGPNFVANTFSLNDSVLERPVFECQPTVDAPLPLRAH